MLAGRRRSPARRLTDTAEDTCRIERTLASARAFLSIAALIAIYLDPTEPTRYVTLAYTLLAAYAAGALMLLAYIRLVSRPPPRLGQVVHAADLCFAALITLFTDGPNSPFFVFFVFALTEAAYRWGLAATLATACAGVSLLAFEAVLLGSEGETWLFTGADRVEGQFNLNRLVMRTTYLVIIGALLGFLGERQKELRREAAHITWILARLGVGMGVTGTMRVLLDAVLKLFDAPKVLCVVEEQETGRLVRWEARRTPNGQPAAVKWEELDRTQRHTYLFSASGHSWALVSRRDSGTGSLGPVVVVDDQGRRMPAATLAMPAAFGAAHDISSLFAVSLPPCEEWTGRLFVLDPSVGSDWQHALQFAQRLTREVAPAAYNIYLLHRLRTRAEALERARLARDLHDGITQSLVSAEMQIDLLRRQAESEAPRLAGELGRIRGLLRHEVLSLRELMQQMKAIRVRPDQLLDHLADIIDRFQRETGIAARFVSNVRQDAIPLRQQACHQIAQIVREALVNIRRHSGARHALISLTASIGHVKLSIDDDGRGFPFSGRFGQAELERLHRGPQVIKERTRVIGGELTLESTPGMGARLEITLR